MEDPRLYNRLLSEYHRHQLAVINEFNIPPYHFSASSVEGGVDKDPDSPFFFFNSCLPKLVHLIEQYHKRMRELQSDIRQIEQKKNYYEGVHRQIHQENEKSKLELSRASNLEMTGRATGQSNSQQHLLREYVVLLKRENKVLQKQIESFRNYVERNPSHLIEDPKEARRKNEIYLNTIVERSKRKEDRLKMKLAMKERERLQKKKLFQRKKKRLEELGKLYGAKIEEHRLRLDQKKAERSELKRNLSLQERDLRDLKKEVHVLREEKISGAETKLKDNQKKELHFLEQLSSLEKKRVELNLELENVRKKTEFYENILDEKRKFEETRQQTLERRYRKEDKTYRKKNEEKNLLEIEQEKKDLEEITRLRKELERKKSELREMKEAGEARREKMISPEEEKRFEQLLERNRDLYMTKIRLSNNLKKLEKQIKKKQMKLRIVEQYHPVKKRRNIGEEEEENEEEGSLENNWDRKVKKAEEDMIREIESATSLREHRDNEKIKAKREQINQLSNRLNFLKSENQKFSFHPSPEEDERRRNIEEKSPSIVMIEQRREQEEIDREREYLETIRSRKRELTKRSSRLKDELKKQKMSIDERKFRVEVLKRRIKNCQSRTKTEEERINALLSKQENLLKKKTEVLVALRNKEF